MNDDRGTCIDCGTHALRDCPMLPGEHARVKREMNDLARRFVVLEARMLERNGPRLSNGRPVPK